MNKTDRNKIIKALKEAASINTGKVYVFPFGNAWLLKKEGQKTTKKFTSKFEALEQGKSIAKQNKSSLIVNNKLAQTVETYNFESVGL